MLSINDLKPEDSGYYYCIASNQFGGDRCFIYLDVKAASLSQPTQTPQEPQSNDDMIVTDQPSTNTIMPKNANGFPNVLINGSESRISPDFLEVNVIEGKYSSI